MNILNCGPVYLLWEIVTIVNYYHGSTVAMVSYYGRVTNVNICYGYFVPR